MTETKTAAPGPEGTAATAPPAKEGGAAPAPAKAEAKPPAAKKDDKAKAETKAKPAIVTMADGEIEIFPSRPLPEMNSYGAIAYEANDRRMGTRQVALLCTRNTVPRITYGGSYKNLKTTSIVRMLDVGIVDWPDGRQYLAYIFDYPQGRKYLMSPEGRPLKLPEDKLIPALILPVVNTLAEMRNVDMVHGAINLENLYLGGSEGSETTILGECLTSAPSTRQHAIYESVERAMAQPMGRGPGRYKDDLYAFGICVAMIARGENLMVGRTTAEIIEDKIQHGSYSSVVGRERLPGGIGEFLRGVLNDDEMLRWDIDDALRWCEGRRLSPKPYRPPAKASRAYSFMDGKYWDLRSLAEAFSRHPGEAAKEIEGDQFDLWVKRNFDDKLLEKRLEKIYTTERLSGPDKLVCRVCMTLDPRAPLRFRRLHLFPEGFGDALADAYARGEDVQVYGDFINQQVVNAWINLRHEEISDSNNILSTFEKCRNYLAQKIPGYGLERLLYVLNNEVACMSPMLKSHIVLTPGHLLQALESMAAEGTNDRLLDRHMIAFISVREPKMIDPHLGQVISADRGTQLVGVIRTLAAIQKRFATGPVPALANMLIGQAAPAWERFSDRDTRGELQKKLERLRDRGEFGDILELLDSPQQLQDDKQRFQQARAEFAYLQSEKERINDAIKGKKFFGYATGRQVAMLASAGLSTIIIVSYVVLHMAGGG